MLNDKEINSNVSDAEIEKTADMIIMCISGGTKKSIKESIINAITYLLQHQSKEPIKDEQEFNPDLIKLCKQEIINSENADEAAYKCIQLCKQYAAQSKSAGVWVKASERLPFENEDKIGGWIHIRNTGTHPGTIWFDKGGFMPPLTEWLDESGAINSVEGEAENGWISVKDENRLPDIMETVQLIESNKYGAFRIKNGFIDKLKKWSVYFDDNESSGYYPSDYVTHWQPLPKLPTQ